MRMFACALLALTALVGGADLAFSQSPAAGGPTPSPEGAKVYFVDLKDGAVIAPNATVHFGLRGMGVAPAGSEKANSGHHHLLIDTALPPLDEPIPNDFNHMHFGAGQTEVDLALTPGPHTLQLLLGDKNHIPHSPPVMSEVVHVTVVDPAAAPAAAAPAPAPAASSASAGSSLASHRSAPGARVFIVSPADGAAVPLTLQVRFGLENMDVARAGVDRPNSGHHHLLIDAPLPPLEEPIPNDENHLHFGAGQTEATITLTPGKHTLQLLVGDANHVPQDPPVFSAPITVLAGQAAERKACGKDEALNGAGVCAPREPAAAAKKPKPRPKAPPPNRNAQPRPPRWMQEESEPPRTQRPPEPAQTFDDLRRCPPGTHSQTTPFGGGYKCVLN